MQIRHARFADLEAVNRIEQDNFSQEEQIVKEVLAFYLEHEQKTCLVIEDEGVVAGYILALPTEQATVTDDLFERLEQVDGPLPYLAIVSLSVADAYKGQGVGTLLLAAMRTL